jgi:hypothetical protein
MEPLSFLPIKISPSWLLKTIQKLEWAAILHESVPCSHLCQQILHYGYISHARDYKTTNLHFYFKNGAKRQPVGTAKTIFNLATWLIFQFDNPYSL